MRTCHTALIIIFGAAILAGCAQESAGESESQLRPITKSGSLVRSFEFLGCSGGWPKEERAPDVWQTDSERGSYFLVHHIDTCGYTIGSKPSARIHGGSLELSYELSNTDGMLAACECEYWAKFQLTTAPEKIETISINGRKARLMGSLVER